MVGKRSANSEKETSANFKETLQIPPQKGTQFQAAEVCWLCIYPIHGEKIRDHDHLSAKYRVGSH